jgi:hypothetical protein
MATITASLFVARDSVVFDDDVPARYQNGVGQG